MKTVNREIAFLKGKAVGIWISKNWINDKSLSGHCKSYDPLTIIKEKDGTYTCLSYVFDFHDGGREHKFNSLEEINEALNNEVKRK